MSTHYSFYLRVGFKVPTEDLQKVFFHQKAVHEEGVFHMEDRYDPKTGVKLEPVQVWDRKPKNKTERWWEIAGERFDRWDDEIMSEVFAAKLGCYVDAYWQDYGNDPDDTAFGFYPHHPNNDHKMDGDRFEIHNLSMDYKQVCEMQSMLQNLKVKLLGMGIEPGEAKVFLGEVSG